MYKNAKTNPHFGLLSVDTDSDSDHEDDDNQQDAATAETVECEAEMVSSTDFTPVKKEKKVRKKTEPIGRLSRFQVYVKRAPGQAYGQAYNMRELTALFSRFGELNEAIECPASLPGVAFVKFRTRAAARAAVQANPITAGNLSVQVEFLDLERQSANVEWNREQERLLMLNEPNALAAEAETERRPPQVPKMTTTAPRQQAPLPCPTAASSHSSPVYAQPVLAVVAQPVPLSALSTAEAAVAPQARPPPPPALPTDRKTLPI